MNEQDLFNAARRFWETYRREIMAALAATGDTEDVAYYVKLADALIAALDADRPAPAEAKELVFDSRRSGKQTLIDIQKRLALRTAQLTMALTFMRHDCLQIGKCAAMLAEIDAMGSEAE